MKASMDAYLREKDWRVNANSNVSYSFSGLFLYLAENQIADYTLRKVYPKNISNAHTSGDLYLHNLSFGIVGYCAGWDLKMLLSTGFNGVPSKIEARPPRHLDTALLQIANFMGTIQNEWAGAQAFNSMNTLLAPYVANDKLGYKQIKQAMQTFIFNMNVTSRWGGQTPFTNLTMDLNTPEDLAEQHAVIGGRTIGKTYADFEDEAEMINRAFVEVMMGGDKSGRPFTFPIPTYNIDKQFDWDSEQADNVIGMAVKYGLPYFSNFINTDMKPSDIRSMCCHLRLDMRQLRRNVRGGIFGSGDLTGSVGVVTMNMPRLAYRSKDEDEFFERLDDLMVLAKDSLEIKRKVVQRNIDCGLIPYTKRYLGSLENHFSTIGLVGMTEACENLFGESIATKQGRDFSIKTLEHMLEQLKKFQKETGHFYNLEATPAEGCSYELALKDKQKYPKIKTGSSRVPRYTSSTYLPVDCTDNAVEAIMHQEPLQSLYTGGTVFHTFMEKSGELESCKAFMKNVFTKTRIPYFTFTPTYSICMDHGYITGEHFKCPTCGEPAEVYSRVVGYLRPVHNWNKGKQEEFRQRLEYGKCRTTMK